MNVLIFLIILSIIWTVSPFLHKELYNEIQYENIVCFKYIVLSILFIFYSIYDYKNKKIAFNQLCENKKLFKYFILTIFLSIFGSYIYYTLLKTYNVTKIMPVLKSLSLITILIFGYLVFNEEITKKKLIGIILIALGMFYIN